MLPRQTFSNLDPAKQARIIDVATEEFSENGFQQASLNTIVKRLGIAKGSIFQYFKDKQGLFLFVFNISLDRVKATLRDVRDQTADEDFFTRIEKTLDAGTRFIHQHPVVYRLYLRALFESRIPFREDILLSIRRYSHDYLRSLIITGKQRGELRADVDPDMAGFMFDAVLDRFLQAQCIEHLDAGLGLYDISEADARRWITGLVAMLRSGLSTP